MAEKKLDAAQVMTAYSAVLRQTNRTLVREERELPYPKHVLKGVIQLCMQMAGPGPERDFLRDAYIGLSDFQQLSPEEKSLLKTWKSSASADSRQDPVQQQMASAAKSLADGEPVATRLTERVNAESKRLMEELRTAGL